MLVLIYKNNLDHLLINSNRFIDFHVNYKNMLAWYGSETYAMPIAISPSKSNAPITFNTFFMFFIFVQR